MARNTQFATLSDTAYCVRCHIHLVEHIMLLDSLIRVFVETDAGLFGVAIQYLFTQQVDETSQPIVAILLKPPTASYGNRG